MDCLNDRTYGKFVSKNSPTIVEAWRIPNEGDAPDDHLSDLIREHDWEADDDGVAFRKFDGSYGLALPGSWLVRKSDGEFTTYSANKFRQTHVRR